MEDKIIPMAMSENDAAAYLGISRISLRQGRSDGKRSNRMPPPPFVRVGRKILYIKKDLDDFLIRHRVTFDEPDDE